MAANLAGCWTAWPFAPFFADCAHDQQVPAFIATPYNPCQIMGVCWCVQDILRGHKMRATGACIGAVIGLVAITPAAGELREAGCVGNVYLPV